MWWRRLATPAAPTRGLGDTRNLSVTPGHTEVGRGAARPYNTHTNTHTHIHR